MPVYEYEHVEGDCELGETRFAVIQRASEDALEDCPWCGEPVKRVVSRVSVVKSRKFSAGKAADRGFTTWRRAGFGQWEKVAGEGVDGIVADPADVDDLRSENGQ
jgi:putative FmdB family regulatory protein